jgi:hypothetical protein
LDVVDIWTGRHATALRTALRLTNEGMAEILGTSVRAVAKWNAEPDLVPITELQRALDTALTRAPQAAQARFGLLMAPRPSSSREDERTAVSASIAPFAANVELRLSHDTAIADALSWLDERADWNDGEAEQRVRRRLEQFDIQRLRNRARRRNRIPRHKLASSLIRYYDIESANASTYEVGFGDQSITTSVLTSANWLDLGLPLGQGNDHLFLNPEPTKSSPDLDDVAAQAATDRIADTLATDTRLINKPLYQLRELDLTSGRLTGCVSLTDFTTYALTMDLLERETLDAVATDRAGEPHGMPLRARFLPTVEAVTSLSERLCAGGPLALFAAARPKSRFNPNPDYVLLIQQRSDRVLNATGRLAVIPKAFHEPLVDFSDDAQLSATLERELEEELFGRADLDTTEGERRQADPFHLSRLSDPMRWLIDHSDPAYWRMECTGYGLSLVSGNFEFACLIVIEDEEWWSRYGGRVEANWETEGLRRYSSLDGDGLTNLVHDGSWSNEGLFALLQGLRRLRETGGNRVSLPPIRLEV